MIEILMSSFLRLRKLSELDLRAQEACVHLHRTLQLIESHGCKSGVVYESCNAGAHGG